MTPRHLLVTNDFPPKVGGIQQYLWELWRRLDPSTFEVHTTPYGATTAFGSVASFDAEQPYKVHRSTEPFLLPYPWLPRRLDRAAQAFQADLHVIDPAVPLGLVGPFLERPYSVVLHGAEVTVPGRLPGSRQLLARVLKAAGRALRNVVIPPGVDVDRFKPIDEEAQREVRAKFQIPADAPFVLSVSRLVPRKGMDTLVAVASELRRSFPDLVVCIAGDGRDTSRLQRRIDMLRAPVRLLGRISEDDKAGLLASADLFAMLCRNRWGGLEQEGFGIVFVEAAACGTPQIAGRSGGADEAVVDGRTGRVAESEYTVTELVELFADALRDDVQRKAWAQGSRARAVEQFSYDVLATRLSDALEDWVTP